MKKNISKLVIAAIVAISVFAGTALVSVRPAAACTGGSCGGTIGILSVDIGVK
ncbi:MAG: hypothetical protein M1546_01865 [Chloroflexi bacterium]|nr:hypothetical protein [Chloroflexota bacterium]